MAIIPLKQVSVYCMKADASRVMHALQERGVLHVASALPETEGMQQFAHEAQSEGILDKIGFALEVVRKYDTEKSSFLSAKPDVSPKEFRALKDKSGIAGQAYQAAKELEERLSSIRSDIQKKTNQVAALKPFAKMDMPLSYLRGTQATDVFLGYLPENAADQTKAWLEEMGGLVYAEFYEKANQALPALIIAHKGVSRAAREFVKTAGFSDARLEELHETPGEIMKILEGEIRDLEAQRERGLQDADSVLRYKKDLLALEDYYRGVAQREQALQKIIASRSVALIQGYVKHYEVEKLEQAVSAAAEAYYIDARDPAEDDGNLPTAVENNALVTPFEAVTDMYSVPSARTFDANALMMPFYFVFFGMMLSDAAYGIILTVGSIVFLKMKKPEGTFKKILTVLAICGISTIIWGSGFGGWMGFTLTPWLFDPLKDPLTMLILCISLGIIHLLAGLGMGVYINIRRKRYAAAIFDQGFWILILASVPFIALGQQTLGLGMLAVGAAGVVATAGRHNKGIIKKIMGGLSGLYGITGYLSDVLSYARLFGMALATGVIAMVFNTIAGMVAENMIGIPFAIIVFLIGHVFNIGINSLGAFVHSARLQYIEFFSKFYEGGGRSFNPLSFKLKNMRMVK